MTDFPLTESEVKVMLLESAWQDFGISLAANGAIAQWLDKSMNMFLMSQSYRDASLIHFANPVNQRGGIPDDMDLQQFRIDIKRRWKLFIVERMGLAPIHPYELGPNQERSY